MNENSPNGPKASRERDTRKGAPLGNQNRTTHGLERKRTRRGPVNRDRYDDAASRAFRRYWPGLKDHPSRSTWLAYHAASARLKATLDRRGWMTSSGEVKEAAKLHKDYADRLEELNAQFRDELRQGEPGQERRTVVVLERAHYTDRPLPNDYGDVVKDDRLPTHPVHDLERCVIDAVLERFGSFHRHTTRGTVDFHWCEAHPDRPVVVVNLPAPRPEAENTASDATGSPRTGERTAKGSEDTDQDESLQARLRREGKLARPPEPPAQSAEEDFRRRWNAGEDLDF